VRSLEQGDGVKVFSSLAEFAGATGADLGVTDWLEISQDRVDQFAEATGDHQWIHVDPGRAATGPFGGTIAHGLLTLSLLPRFMHELYRVDGARLAINYGLNKVRFVSPVPVGAKIRARSTVADISPVTGGFQATVVTIIEIEGSEKPAAVIESIIRYVG
jgi:acyl dehydratase